MKVSFDSLSFNSFSMSFHNLVRFLIHPLDLIRINGQLPLVLSSEDVTIFWPLRTIQTEVYDSYHSLCIGLTRGKQGSHEPKRGQSMKADIMIANSGRH